MVGRGFYTAVMLWLMHEFAWGMAAVVVSILLEQGVLQFERFMKGE